jgi:hypothetical protein
VGPQWRAVRFDFGRKSLPTIEVALAREVAMARRIGIAVHRIICGFDIAGITSALRSITEVQRTSQHFAFVPMGDIAGLA